RPRPLLLRGCRRQVLIIENQSTSRGRVIPPPFFGGSDAEHEVDSVRGTIHSFDMFESKFATMDVGELERLALKFESEQRLDEARGAFDAALLIDPSSRSCAEGRARIAIRLREERAAEHCARALAFHDADP